MRVPFYRPVILESHAAVMNQVLAQASLSGDGVYGRRVEAFLSQWYKTTVLLCSSATHALEMSALLLNFGPGDEVIMPSFTFVSCANALILRGVSVRFADNDPFGHLSLVEIKKHYTKKTKAVMVVHYAGQARQIQEIAAFCAAHQIYLIEDAAQAIGASYQSQLLGTFGQLACISFHDTKNIGCGEGGALLINDPQLVARAYRIREKGTNRQQFKLGLVDKYTWVDCGSSYVLSELNAAFLWPQLEQFEWIQQRRAMQWQRYYNALASHFTRGGRYLLTKDQAALSNYHLFAIVLASEQERTRFIEHHKQVEITTPFHYVALHQSPYAKLHFKEQSTSHLPGCERLSSTLVRLPLYHDLSEQAQDYVIERALSFELEKDVE